MNTNDLASGANRYPPTEKEWHLLEEVRKVDFGVLLSVHIERHEPVRIEKERESIKL